MRSPANLFIRARLYAPWHVSKFYVENPRRHIREHLTLCGDWIEINQAEGAEMEAEQVPEACRKCAGMRDRRRYAA